jgi:hypothetical protein
MAFSSASSWRLTSIPRTEAAQMIVHLVVVHIAIVCVSLVQALSDMPSYAFNDGEYRRKISLCDLALV